MVYCSECGTKNNKTDKVCKNCESTLIKPEYFGFPEYTDFSQLFTDKNKKILNKMSFSVSAYYTILNNITNQAKINYNRLLANISYEDYQNMNFLAKIELITVAFTKIEHKIRGGDLGHYKYNVIDYDDRLESAHQATTLIHELTHHIVYEIFEQTLMYLLEVKKSEVIEAYVKFSLSDVPSRLMNEFCAHTIQNIFTPHGHQNFGSFIIIRNENGLNNKESREFLQFQSLFGNALATDILGIIDEFISPELRNEIIDQYRGELDSELAYTTENLEIYEELPQEIKVFLINLILSSAFEEAQKTELRGFLNGLKEKFDMNNKSN